MNKSIASFLSTALLAASPPGGVDPWTPEGLSEDLYPIAHLESSWGKNVDHPIHPRGVFETPVGALGFKPSTAHEEYLRVPKIRKTYPGFEDSSLFLNEFQKKHSFYNALASLHFARLKNLHGSAEKAAYAWRWGSTATAAATSETIEAEPYVQKYKALRGIKRLGKSQREKETVSVVSVAAYCDGLLLFGLRGDKRKWCLPGGHVEPGEEHLKGAKRELLEETGLEGENWQYLGSGQPKEGLTVYCYRCEVNETPDSSSDPDAEFVEFQWTDPHDLPQGIRENLYNKIDVNLDLQGFDYEPESLDKSVLDPRAGYVFSQEPHIRGLKIRAHLKGKPVGEVTVNSLDADLRSEFTYVHPDHRRKGLASAMYEYAEKIAKKSFVPSKHQTQEGRVLWTDTRRPFGKAEDYVGIHKAPTNTGDNAPAHDLAQLYPEDFYTHPQAHSFYGHGGSAVSMDKQTLGLLRSLRGKPESLVKVYRAVPKTLQNPKINAGDWVTPNKDYAKLHGEGSLGGNYQIIEHTVPAKHLFTDANSIHEFGYDSGIEKTEQLDHELVKSRPGPVFPKLGIGDDRRETDQVTTVRQLRIKQLAQANAVANDEGKAIDRIYGAGALHGPAPSEIKAKGRQALRARFTSSGSTVLGSAAPSNETKASYALGTPLLPPSESKTSSLAIQLHENSHQIFQRVEQKYGKQARENLAQNLWYHATTNLESRHQGQIEQWLDLRYPKAARGAKDFEERINTVLNFVNDPNERDRMATGSRYETVRKKRTSTGEVVRDSMSPATAAKKVHLALRSGGRLADTDWLAPHHEFRDFYPEMMADHKAGMYKNEQEWFVDDEPGIRILALKSKSPKLENLELALSDENPDVRFFAAQHPALTFEQLFNVLTHKDVGTRLAGLSNPSITEEHLDFAQHDPELAWAVAQLPARQANFAKNIGFVEFPKMNAHVRTHPMPMSSPDASKRKALMGDSKKGISGGKLYFTANTNPEKGQPGRQRRMSGFVTNGFAGSNNTDLKGASDHEAQHSVFAHLTQRHGIHAAQAAVDHVMSGLTGQERGFLNLLNPQLEKYAPAKRGEETIAYMQNFLQEPARRQKMLADFAPNGRKLTEVGQRKAHQMVKGIWKRMRDRASEFGPDHIESYKARFQKNESTKDCGNPDLHLALDLPEVSQDLLSAAEFLSGRRCDASLFRSAYWREENDCAAALISVGLEPSVDNLQSLKNVQQLKALKKNEHTVSIKKVTARFADGQKMAEIVQKGVDGGLVEFAQLEGKHIKNAVAVKDPETNNWFLLKPGQGKPSPAKGVVEQTATPSAREACFFAVAKLLELDERVLETHLIDIDGSPAAMMPFLPTEWVPLESLKRENGSLPQQILEKYQKTGELHVWAVLDYVLGSADRHGQNLMSGPSSENHPVVLIDHGSSFAGKSFSPGTDQNSFVPYYLRAHCQEAFKNSLDPNIKMKLMPTTSDAGRLFVKSFIEKLNPAEIESVLVKFGVDPVAVIERVKLVRQLLFEEVPVDTAINRLWIVGP